MVKLSALVMAGFGLVASMGMESDSFEKKYTLNTEFGHPVDVSVKATDLDNDGNLDFLWGSPHGILRAEVEDGKVKNKRLIFKLEKNRNPNMRVGLDVGDLNSDGLNDIAFATPDGVRVLENKGNDKFEDKGYVIKNQNYFVSADVDIADVNNDGKQDIVYATSPKTEIWYQK